MSVFTPNRKCVVQRCLAFAREGLVFCVEHEAAKARDKAKWIREYADRPRETTRIGERVRSAK